MQARHGDVAFYNVDVTSDKDLPTSLRSQVEITFILNKLTGISSYTFHLQFKLLSEENSFIVELQREQCEMNEKLEIYRLNNSFSHVLKQFSDACESEIDLLTAVFILSFNNRSGDCRYPKEDENEHCFVASYDGRLRLILKTDLVSSTSTAKTKAYEILNNVCFKTSPKFFIVVFTFGFTVAFFAVKSTFFSNAEEDFEENFFYLYC